MESWTERDMGIALRTHSNYGDRCFSAAGPKLWNSLPAELRQVDIGFQ